MVRACSRYPVLSPPVSAFSHDTPSRESGVWRLCRTGGMAAAQSQRQTVCPSDCAMDNRTSAFLTRYKHSLDVSMGQVVFSSRRDRSATENLLVPLFLYPSSRPSLVENRLPWLRQYERTDCLIWSIYLPIGLFYYHSHPSLSQDVILLDRSLSCICIPSSLFSSSS